MTTARLVKIVNKANAVMPSVKAAMAKASVKVQDLRIIQNWAKLKRTSKIAYYCLVAALIAEVVSEVLQSFLGIEISESLSKALDKAIPDYKWPDTPDELAAAIEMFMSEATPAQLALLAATLQEEGVDLSFEDGVDVTDLIDEDKGHPISKMLEDSNVSYVKEIELGDTSGALGSIAGDSPVFARRLKWLQRIRTVALRGGYSVAELVELQDVLRNADMADFKDAELVD
jgi:uncharacterized protein (DUF302 family)